ncbi:iron ABC transporter permease [Puniceibacterium sp. IMCC21224]|uniref:FecCD family ABC transporter permease n=1 Tax=Puniceibacterium sp. IMCC21224 TaxID=1618204 RepID=UPI00065CFD5E|nr:iron ABC transporter permease [Puniceibacterium sp. IMCC21224]KMK67002.1 ABC-type Fe3+-siderophore transport system, permease component [Puniceibacterium sp. IMCC21224]
MSAMTDAAITPEAILDQHSRTLRRRALLVAAIGALVVLTFLLDLFTGATMMSPSAVLKALFGTSDVPTDALIVWNVRLPQTLTALLVGAALALAGAEMQTILDNPLASPFTLGVSSAASLGAALALIANVSLPWLPISWLVPVNAFVFAAAAMLILQFVASRLGRGPGTIVLLGIALVFGFNALVALLQFTASQSALQEFVHWTLGSLSQTKWSQLAVLAVCLAVVAPWSMASSWQLTALRLGEDRARALGIDTGRLRLAALLRVTLLAAISVAFVGTIGFIGLVAPHIARLAVGEDHRFFLPASALVGAAVLLASSTLSKVLIPGVLLPTGIVTSLVGLPVFLALILRRGA